MSKNEGNPVNNEKFSIGNRMRLARMGCELTVDELAVRMGIKPVSVYSRENGNDRVTGRFLGRVERGLGVKESTILNNSCSLYGEPEEKVELGEFGYHRRAGGIARRIRKQLKDTIRRGGYQNGLPSTQELSSRYGITRTAVIDALRPLAKEGIIESRKKGGRRVIAK